MSAFWCVTTFFNPAGYRSRLTNYRIFADRLADQGVRLLTVELAFGDRPFELPDASDLIRLRAKSVLWQKERLINHALARLPPECDRFAWMDCDLLFPDRHWADRLAEKLLEHDILQLFARVVHLAPGETHVDGTRLGSNVGLARQVLESPDWLSSRRAGRLPFAVPGYGWGAVRSVFDGLGLYDRLILGNGDAFLADCLFGSFGLHHYWQVCTNRMAADMDRWRARLADCHPLRCGHLAGEVYHLWHGQFSDRRYRERDAILSRHEFDPAVDLVEREGVYEWASDKLLLHGEVKDYFAARAEDC